MLKMEILTKLCVLFNPKFGLWELISISSFKPNFDMKILKKKVLLVFYTKCALFDASSRVRCWSISDSWFFSTSSTFSTSSFSSCKSLCSPMLRNWKQNFQQNNVLETGRISPQSFGCFRRSTICSFRPSLLHSFFFSDSFHLQVLLPPSQWLL